jgi:hypothetical protein
VDAATAWLREHDMNYRGAGWKDIRDSGEYRMPRQEVPWGGADDLALLVASGSGDYVRSLPWTRCRDHRCRIEFVPVTPWQEFCSGRCRLRAHRRKRR